jgi:hypothetical protein
MINMIITFYINTKSAFQSSLLLYKVSYEYEGIA